MDVSGVDVIEGNNSNRGTCAPSNNGGEAEPLGESHDATACARDQDEVIVEPQVGMEFSTKDAAFNFYEEYAKRVGFGTRVAQAPRLKPGTPITAREFLCAREGSKRKPDDSCEAMLKVELNGERWVVTRFVKDHNHSTMSPSKVHYLRPKRHFAGSTKNAATPETCQVAGVAPSPTGVMPTAMDGNRSSGEANSGSKSAALLEPNRQMRNINPVNYANSVNYAVRPAARTKILGKDAQDMLDYFRKMQAENPGFFYAIQLNEENRMANAFWADARSRTAYSNFGDFVFFDTSYRVNQYKVPFAPFTGVNHHGQSILFGCALLQDDSEASFTWLFKTFLAAMHNQAPVSIVTDQDRAIKAGVTQVFPKARHRISMWDVLKEGQDRLLHVCLIYPNFQVELYNCINVTETVEEFESSWASIIEKYSLRRNDWLQSVYNMRKLWVPVYFRDSFFAALSPHQGLTTSFFDGYINRDTTLPMFFRQYESAMENWFEKEKEADFDTMCTTPVLRTPSPMEKQAANLYTKKIFAKFQQQLVETFVYTANKIDGDSTTSAYRVAKFEDNHKANVVTLNNSDLRAHCSCKMFEYSGILCRHVLTVFTVTNVLTLPSHFILKRWTRDAKSGLSLDERGVDSVQESMTLRYNNLCREAIKYAEEGSVARETYKTALAGLREGGKKVAVMKKNVAKVASPSSLAAGTCLDDNKTSGDVTPLLWPRQDQVGRRFNLNDSGNAPRQMADLNLPRMALQRDNGTSENMAVLRCLKSMTWAMENKHLAPASRIAVINLKLQDHSKTPAGDSEVKFQLSTVTLEPMMRSMAHINEQLTSPANRVAVINLKLQDTEATSGESEVKFQVSRDTLGAMLRSMAYIREQLCIVQVEPQTDPSPKRPKK